MRKKKDTHSFDFRPLGLAIREAREKAGLSRNDLGDKVFYGERHIADIEISENTLAFSYSMI